jgi:hypothetical protein
VAHITALEPRVPRLTAEAFSELIAMPAHEHLRIIREQKYPKRAPAMYQVPYYSQVMTAIRQFHKSGNNVAVLSEAIMDLQSTEQNAKTKNNIRAIEAFRDSVLKDRRIQIRTVPRQTIRFGTVEVRFTPDLCGLEGDAMRYFILNPRRQDANDEIARMTLELGYHILYHNGIVCKLNEFEYVNLLSNQVMKAPRFRQGTITKAERTAQIVEALWESI